MFNKSVLFCFVLREIKRNSDVLMESRPVSACFSPAVQICDFSFFSRLMIVIHLIFFFVFLDMDIDADGRLFFSLGLYVANMSEDVCKYPPLSLLVFRFSSQSPWLILYLTENGCLL